MGPAIGAIVKKCKWKLSCALRCHRYYSAGDLVQLYKSRLLGYIEYRTAAIYHAANSHLQRLDSIQRQLMDAVDLSDVEALFTCNLAPLCSRRDIAMLGLIHRTMLGVGPQQFQDFSADSRNSSNMPVDNWSGTVGSLSSSPRAECNIIGFADSE